MDHELSPDELESLLAAYAIDAVDDDERRAVEEHLRRSPAAADEVARLREAAAIASIAAARGPVGAARGEVAGVGAGPTAGAGHRHREPPRDCTGATRAR